jgi:FAD/FMN-containing dehydrogenase
MDKEINQRSVSNKEQKRMGIMTVRSLDNTNVNVDTSAIDDLRSRLRGPLLTATDPGYGQAGTLWNGMITRRPAIIVRCLGTADIITAVNFARERGIAISVRGGGHNIAGLAVCDGGLMLDMSLRRGVWVDTDGRTAIAQTGCTIGDLDNETQLHGLASCLGFVSKTGIAGLTVGGGLGYLSRRFGWTSDTVRSMDVVTADGRLVHTDEHQHPELFWGLRGGGGNFGIVTNIEYSLFPVGPEIVGGAIAWPIDQADRVLEKFREFAGDAPPEMTCVAAVRPAPPAPWLPKDMHGKLVVLIIVCYTGPVGEGERLVAPLKAFGSPIGNVLQRRSYVSQQSLLDATQPEGRRYYWKAEYLPRLAPEMIQAVIGHASRIPSPHSMIALFQLGGAVNRLPEGHSAVGNREAQFVMNIAAAWETHKDDQICIEWARSTWRDLRKYSTGGTYVNFLTEDEGDDRVHAAFGRNYGRLVEIKRKWDPLNFFRSNKNIMPM